MTTVHQLPVQNLIQGFPLLMSLLLLPGAWRIRLLFKDRLHCFSMHCRL